MKYIAFNYQAVKNQNDKVLITITQNLKGEILKKVGGGKFITYQSPFLFEEHKINNKFNFIGKLYVDIHILKS